MKLFLHCIHLLLVETRLGGSHKVHNHNHHYYKVQNPIKCPHRYVDVDFILNVYHCNVAIKIKVCQNDLDEGGHVIPPKR